MRTRPAWGKIVVGITERAAIGAGLPPVDEKHYEHLVQEYPIPAELVERTLSLGGFVRTDGGGVLFTYGVLATSAAWMISDQEAPLERLPIDAADALDAIVAARRHVAGARSR